MRNIVLISYDSLRADHCGYMGYDRDTTPTLDRWSEEGVTFQNAIAPASRTSISMSSVHTGDILIRDDSRTAEEFARRHFNRNETIANKLSRKGYNTGAFSPNAYASRYYGFDEGFDHFEDFMFDSSIYQKIFGKHKSESEFFTALRNIRNAVLREEVFKTWDKYINDVESWVDEQGEPFFLWIFSLEPHFPYLTPRKYRQWGSLIDMYYYNWLCNNLIDQFNINIDEEKMQKIIDIYDDSIRFADRLLRSLQQRFEEYDPIYIVHGDHGEAFNEHSVYGHFYPSFYEENIHVPLTVYNANREPLTIDRPISLTAIPKIIEISTEPNRDYKSLGGKFAIMSDYDARRGRRLIGVRTKNWKFISTETNEGVNQELYNIKDDPIEQDNLINKQKTNNPLVEIMENRKSHENELLSIQRFSRSLEGENI